MIVWLLSNISNLVEVEQPVEGAAEVLSPGKVLNRCQMRLNQSQIEKMHVIERLSSFLAAVVPACFPFPLRRLQSGE